MSTAEQLPLVSPEEYLAAELLSEVRHEYLGGNVYAMAGASNRHNRIAGNCFASLHRQLSGQPCEPFNSDTKVRVLFPSHTRFYYPDGMVVCNSNPADDSFQDQPVVIAEVVSESTRRTDMNEKREAYLSIPTLKVYLLIEQDQPRVSVHRRQQQGFAAELFTGLDTVVPLNEIDADLPLKELYERVEFPPT